MWSTATDPLENQFRQSAAVKKPNKSLAEISV
jgi:hypothetical protein